MFIFGFFFNFFRFFRFLFGHRVSYERNSEREFREILNISKSPLAMSSHFIIRKKLSFFSFFSEILEPWVRFESAAIAWKVFFLEREMKMEKSNELWRSSRSCFSHAKRRNSKMKFSSSAGAVRVDEEDFLWAFLKFLCGRRVAVKLTMNMKYLTTKKAPHLTSKIKIFAKAICYSTIDASSHFN